jgi:hypothetical protein
MLYCLEQQIVMDALPSRGGVCSAVEHLRATPELEGDLLRRVLHCGSVPVKSRCQPHYTHRIFLGCRDIA